MLERTLVGECLRNKCVRLQNRIPSQVVRTALLEAPLLFQERSSVFSHVRRQDAKAQLNIPVGEALVGGVLPDSIVEVARGLFECAAGYVAGIIHAGQLSPASKAALIAAYPLSGDLQQLSSFTNRASVFRVWTYSCDGTASDEPLCRAHCDPGLCTAMLLGSTPGLEINQVDDIPNNGFGDYRATACRGGDSNWVPVSPADGDVLLLNNTQLQCCTEGNARALPHRVVMPPNFVGERINMVVELRAQRPKQIFSLTSSRQ